MNRLGSEIFPNEVTVNRLSQTPAEGVSGSLWSALSQGYPVAYSGHSNNGLKIIDPLSFDDDSEAIQSLVDWIVSNSEARSTGDVFLPATRPDGWHWTFPRTVEFFDRLNGDEHSISLHGMGNYGNSGNSLIRTGISNGDPVFRFRGDSKTAGSPSHGFVVEGLAMWLDNNDASGIEFVNCSAFELRNCFMWRFGGSGIIMNSGCYTWCIAPQLKPLDPRGIGIEFRDDYPNYNAPGTGAVLPETNISSEHKESIKFSAPVTPTINIGGHFEAATGNASIDIDSPGVDVYITPWATISPTQNGAHGVRFTGANVSAITIAPAAFINIDGDAIKDDTGGETLQQLRISPNTRFEGVNGENMNLTAANRSIIPMAPMKHGMEYIRTQSLYNTLEPNVNAAHPAYRARSKSIFYEASLAGVRKSVTSGSGKVHTDADGLRLETGTVDGSEAHWKVSGAFSADPNATWDKRRTFQTLISLSSVEDEVSVVTGRYLRQDTTDSHIGFIHNGADLLASCGDGSDQTTIALSSDTPSNTQYRLRAEYIPEERIDYYVNDNYEGSIKTNLPYGEKKCGEAHAQATNLSNASVFPSKFDIQLYRVIQHP